jgi:hypothetical protein
MKPAPCPWCECAPCFFAEFGWPCSAHRRELEVEDIHTIDLWQLREDDPHEWRRVSGLAKRMLARGLSAAQVHAETGIRLNTLHQKASRLRGTGTH